MNNSRKLMKIGLNNSGLMLVGPKEVLNRLVNYHPSFLSSGEIQFSQNRPTDNINPRTVSEYGMGGLFRLDWSQGLIGGRKPTTFTATMPLAFEAKEEGLYIATMPKVLAPTRSRSPRLNRRAKPPVKQTLTPPEPTGDIGLSLRSAVTKINALKEELGDGIVFSVGDDGKLKVIVEYS